MICQGFARSAAFRCFPMRLRWRTGNPSYTASNLFRNVALGSSCVRCCSHPSGDVLILPAFYDSYLPKLMRSVTSKHDSSGDIPAIAGMLSSILDFLQFADRCCNQRSWFPYCNISCWEQLALAVFDHINTDSDTNTMEDTQYIVYAPLISAYRVKYGVVSVMAAVGWLVDAHSRFALNQQYTMDLIAPQDDNRLVDSPTLPTTVSPWPFSACSSRTPTMTHLSSYSPESKRNPRVWLHSNPSLRLRAHKSQ